ncbi:MAG: rhamnulokinase [Pirellulaceae bacterium]|nr:rhamnulokinase [Pirellulaceae bacterium]
MQVHLAVDLGAESGRVIAVGLEAGALHFEECHRFGHRPVELPTGLHWNVAQIWSEIIQGLKEAATWASKQGHEIASVGVDTWGVDWCLLNRRGELVGLPHAYRDPRNGPFYEEAVKRLSVERIYQTTGIQMMPINSLYSLFATVSLDPELVDAAAHLIFMPDLFHYWLSGEIAVERTIASTSQMVDPRTGDWARELLEPLGIPQHPLSEIVPAGTLLGKLQPQVARQTGLSSTVKVITPGSHDTASAVAAVPALAGDDWCYLSSGTWSLLGCELDECLTNSEAQAAMFTNEVGVGGKIRFLKNIAGLWLVQECRREWESQGMGLDYTELTKLAEAAEPNRTIIDTTWPDFQSPGEMPAKIARLAREMGQPVPETPAQTVRCALDSLADAYRQTLDRMEKATGGHFAKIHLVGGGARNDLLNRLTAAATGRTVIAGPYEATALGNGLVQALALGELKDLADLRQAVHSGVREMQVYHPEQVS